MPGRALQYVLVLVVGSICRAAAGGPRTVLCIAAASAGSREKLQATETDILATRGPKPFPTKVHVNGFKLSAKNMPRPNSQEDLKTIYKKHRSFSSDPSAAAGQVLDIAKTDLNQTDICWAENVDVFMDVVVENTFNTILGNAPQNVHFFIDFSKFFAKSCSTSCPWMI